MLHDCYVTPTLLNSWLFYLRSRDEYEEKAKIDFLNCLNKIKGAPTEPMLRGIEFENNVYDYTQGKESKDPTVIEIGNIVKSGLWQETVSKIIEVDGLKVLIFGKADVIKRDTIYDIKRVSKYATGKYYDSMQHKIYLCASGLIIFEYLVSTGTDVYCETYTPTSTLERDVKGKILEFFLYLKSVGLFDTYLEKWKGTDKN